MPSLADTLEQLSSHSQQINQLAQLNRRPTGPFTSAYLESHIVPDLIRDSGDAERRLFKFVGETESSIKKVEKREGLITPLKDLQRGKNKGSRNEVEVVLTAVARLVDDYRPMPRARSHIASLTERHEQQIQRIAELEDLIANLNNASAAGTQAAAGVLSSPSPAVAPKPKPVLSADEAIRAEEAALAAMEAMVAPHREAARAASPAKAATPPPRERAPPASPAIRNARPSVFNNMHVTPAKTPAREYPHISNSLVGGGGGASATPYKMNRFTPLKNLGTPRAARERGSIFGQAPRSASGSKRISTIVPPTPIAAAQEIHDDDEEDDDELNQLAPAAAGPTEDDTIRLPRAESSPEKPAPAEESPSSPAADSTPRASPVKLASPVKGPQEVHGVLVEIEAVASATTRILNTATEIAQHAGPDDLRPDAVVELLYRLSTATPEDVPGSDQSATSSALSGPSAAPITKSAILQAHLCLLMLQDPTLTLTRNAAVERLSTFVADKQWGGSAQASKTVFDLVGKKTVTVDRKGAGGPSGALTFQ